MIEYIHKNIFFFISQCNIFTVHCHTELPFLLRLSACFTSRLIRTGRLRFPVRSSRLLRMIPGCGLAVRKCPRSLCCFRLRLHCLTAACRMTRHPGCPGLAAVCNVRPGRFLCIRSCGSISRLRSCIGLAGSTLLCAGASCLRAGFPGRSSQSHALFPLYGTHRPGAFFLIRVLLPFCVSGRHCGSFPYGNLCRLLSQIRYPALRQRFRICILRSGSIIKHCPVHTEILIYKCLQSFHTVVNQNIRIWIQLHVHKFRQLRHCIKSPGNNVVPFLNLIGRRL